MQILIDQRDPIAGIHTIFSVKYVNLDQFLCGVMDKGSKPMTQAALLFLGKACPITG
ncbi:Uncharacterized protein AC499_1374 [Pseudomonas amygdali pv. lachrymans]|uniref:Uncharacterized protein n=1 Tax=Pseudomonas amygdali pv. lachrymans TaxID=53707 RepID=A0ABR5KRE9_PSEAV|nr:Uncharacterized protein AC499_0415 [Pseudomonas amygdali pv. lachrymans]KPC18172.1 Uncharacterized protein AC499_1374 [Pseudomonas amygdali pv. lachrymans]RMT05778.1 hypothetical protein ALP54_102471 [Pseudomonas amygdali pv. lachrymans]